MIARTATAREPTKPPWRAALRDAVRSVDELLRLVDVDVDDTVLAAAAARDFPLRVPRSFVARMRRGDAADPLLRQVLPAADELRDVRGFGDDPLAEQTASPVPGLLHKFAGRALLVVTGACAVHCRYCFRRHFPYADHARSGDDLRPALAYLRDDPTLHEVIFSGGDPLAASDERLAGLAAELAAIPHLRRLRVHSRLPVVLPERVDERLLAWLGGGRLRPVVVVHVNHPQEIDDDVRAAFGRLGAAGVPLLNQTVLLRGINDDVETLVQLSDALFEAGAMPYYLHLMDRVRGAAHFDVDEDAAQRLFAGLLHRLPGYLVPKLVREVPGAPTKVPISPNGY